MATCNGCGNEFVDDADGSGAFVYGGLSTAYFGTYGTARGNHVKTLCPRCMHVIRDVLLSSDLSDHWDKYDWNLMRVDGALELELEEDHD